MKKTNKISELNGNPFIRISNTYLKKHGFNIGDLYEVTYLNNELIIKKITLSDNVTLKDTTANIEKNVKKIY